MKRLSLFSASTLAVTAALSATPATAAVELVDAGCSLSTGCEFNGNIQGAGTALETQNAYNGAKDPDIVLNYLGANNAGFGFASGGPSGTWSAAGFIIDYIAVKSGNQFMLYSVTPGSSSGFYSTAGLQNGNNTSLPDLSHLAFFGQAGAVPEPATWAMMMVGFGAIGGAMRSKNRRRTPSFV